MIIVNKTHRTQTLSARQFANCWSTITANKNTVHKTVTMSVHKLLENECCKQKQTVHKHCTVIANKNSTQTLSSCQLKNSFGANAIKKMNTLGKVKHYTSTATGTN